MKFTDREQRIWDATFGAAYARAYEAMRAEPNTRYPDRYALHMAEHIALCAIEDMRARDEAFRQT